MRLMLTFAELFHLHSNTTDSVLKNFNFKLTKYFKAFFYGNVLNVVFSKTFFSVLQCPNNGDTPFQSVGASI